MTTFSKAMGFAVWATLVTAGLAYNWRYETTAGAAAPLLSDWPTASRLPRDAVLPTFLIFTHPDCPCTRASLGELAELLARETGRARVVVAPVIASGLDPDLERSVTMAAARRIPGVTIVSDPQGVEARRFGAATSGQAFAFSPQGKLLFAGGLTALRGAYGPSAGLDALRSVLRGAEPRVRSTSVYGCALLDGGAR